MYKRGTQSFFFHLPMVIFFLLAIILIGAIVFGIARSKGELSYSPPSTGTGTACGSGSVDSCNGKSSGDSCPVSNTFPSIAGVCKLD